MAANKFNKLSISIILVYLSLSLGAQMTEIQLSNNPLPLNSDSNKLYLKIRNANFIKDNEYFNQIVEGYTLSGYWITPTLEYHPGANSTLEAGIHLLKFSGRDRFFKILPVFTFSQQLNRNIFLILGALNSNSNHNMAEPLLDPERFYFKQVDNGIQFLITSERIKSDVWFTCDSFIWRGDSMQEQFTSGSSSEFVLIKNTGWSFSIPLQTIIAHKGGQINRPKKPIETLMNLGTGLNIEYNSEGGFIKQIRLNPHFLIYNKSTSAEFPEAPYKKGWALYPNVLINSDHLYLKLAWYHSNSFIGPRGEAIYQSVSTEPIDQSFSRLDTTKNEKYRNLFIGKIAYSKNLGKGISINACFEGYYDNHEKLFDYNFSFHLLYSDRFLLHSLKK
jgi:hypothetical protein